MRYVPSQQEHDLRMEVADEHYRRWLASEGITDTEASIGIHMSVGYLGLKGEERRKASKRAYDVLPPGVMVAINREVQTRLERTATRG
tara:strand:- start:252 stop:515 length:264 start_codon:yes stop_codon:yes gene_type:complete